MKGIMKKVTAILIAAVVAAGCIPAASAFAAEPAVEAGAAAIQAEAADTPIFTQTGSTKNSVSISWDADDNSTPIEPCKCAVVYSAYVGGTAVISSQMQFFDGKTVTISNLPENAYVYGVYVYVLEKGLESYISTFMKNPTNYNNYSYKLSTYTYFHTVPTKVTGLKLAYPFDNYTDSRKKLQVAFNASDALRYNIDGYEAVLYNKSGKKLETIYPSKYSSYAEFTKTKTTKRYKARIRPYYLIGSTKKYGDWSSYYYAVPQPNLKKDKKNLKVNSFQVKWSKVSGSSNYVVYVAKSKKFVTDTSGLSFKKVKTIGKDKTSYKVTKVKGEKVNTKKYYYYFYVQAKGKMDGKTRSSKKCSYCLYCHTY